MAADEDATKRAAERFASLAGTQDSTKLVDALVLAAKEQLLETIAGAGTVPSKMTDARAELLYHACIHADRLLKPREVEVLFRALPATAKTILATMNATYEEALRSHFLSRMRENAKVKASGNDEDGLNGRSLSLIQAHSAPPWPRFNDLASTSPRTLLRSRS